MLDSLNRDDLTGGLIFIPSFVDDLDSFCDHDTFCL